MREQLLNFKVQGFDSNDHNIYYVYNWESEFIGVISRVRVGKFMHWIFSPQQQTFFTNSCLKEISKFITKCYSKKAKVSGAEKTEKK